MTKAIRKLNDLLRLELGDHEPYSWRYSEDLMHVARAVDPDTGFPMVDFKCDCGLNKAVHAADCRLTVAVPKFFTCKLRPEKVNQWALCKLLAPPSEEEWATSVGTMLPYPRSGTWVPCDPVWLSPGVPPDEALTDAAIKGVRKERAKTLRMRLQEGEIEVAAREAKNRQNLRDMINEDCYMPFGSLPGVKDSTSVGGTKDLFESPTA